ncbi:hypothetical protein PAECIP111893_03248 [Paenibacillus plantiphilus]|uniref:Uncharacterized protein n=1 Tax=Paenibacillus plantiphilus TaxID=2905650 RepID=A0ABN8GM39_9BACL|nr:hypothetical protein [Paenibacillus plantiphilus]CAH1210695.1 hypothetical protein PAECIP111893_03248 [Paenibacillus plantiphilus]
MGVLFEIVTGSKMDTAKIIHDSMDVSNSDHQQCDNKQEELGAVDLQEDSGGSPNYAVSRPVQETIPVHA